MNPDPVKQFLSKWQSGLSLGWEWFSRVCFVIIFILSIAFFFHFRQVRIDQLELGSVARKYVLAQVGFDFADVETTRVFKEESLREIGPIYYFSDEEICKAEHQIQLELINNPYWREWFPSSTFEEMMHTSDTIRLFLSKAKFSDPRTLQKLEQTGFNLNHCLNCAFNEPFVDPLICVWEKINQQIFDTPIPASDFILEKYWKYGWSLQEDFNLRHLLRSRIKETIPVKTVHVEAGSRIINVGEKVTRRHMDMLKEMKKVIHEKDNLFKPLTILGSVTLALIMSGLAFIYFQTFHPGVTKSFKKMALIATVAVLTLFLAKFTDYYILYKMGYLSDYFRLPIFLLFPTLTLSILIDRHVAVMVSIFIALILEINLGIESYEFLVINLSTALMAIILTKEVRKRKEIFGICSKIGFLVLPMVVAMRLLNNHLGDRQMGIDIITVCCSLFLSAALVVLILPLLESSFGVVTDMALLEAGDPNHPLLRRLSLESPGTYQHSLSVASLAEEAALAIGANALQCRVSALYHDIGKVTQPHYFTENQFSGFNMHQLLTPFESAQVIIQHVIEGVKLAESYELPVPIIEAIQEHHGTSLVYYFYHAQVERSRAKSLEVEEGFFRYPGPTPQSRESAIIMLADSIEAAYRCQDQPDEKAIVDLIEGIVSDKIRDHQLDGSHLTFDDLEAIKKAIFRSLVALSHGRIKYPAKDTAVKVPSTAGARI
ncbi:MAG: HDIG domain-containing protein [Candidatus Rhabdochlamydia sp.]